MRKKQKGFTLIELLGVIIILGIISSIALIVVQKNNQKIQTLYYNTQKKLILISGERYYSDNRNLLPKTVGDNTSVKLTKLIELDYIKSIKDYKKNDCSSNNKSKVNAYKIKKDKYYYSVDLFCNDYNDIIVNDKLNIYFEPKDKIKVREKLLVKIKIDSNNPLSYVSYKINENDIEHELKLTNNNKFEVELNKRGLNTVIVKAVDIKGNTSKMASPAYLIIPKDDPKIILKGNNPFDISLNKEFIEPGYTAIDGDGQNLNVVISGMINTRVAGTYKLIYTANDNYGGSVSVSRIINVKNLPTINLKGNNPMNIPLGHPYYEPGYTARDWNNNNLNAQISGEVNVNQVGAYTITYSITDSLGGFNSITRKVYVKSLPTISLYGNNPMNISLGKSYYEPGYIARDGNGQNLNVVISGMINTNVVGTYKLIYTATDSYGGSVSASRIISVKNLPTINLNGNSPMNISLGHPYYEPGYTARDWNNNNLNAQISGGVNVNQVGTYTITYSITDSLGGFNSITRKVYVRNLPTISLYGDNPMNISLGKSYYEYYYSARDWNNNNLNAQISGGVNVNQVGAYTITYSITDSLGGFNSITRNVYVRNLPTISLYGDNPMNISLGKSYYEYYYSARDWNNNTLNAQISGGVNVNQVGAYTITYSITDSLGGFNSMTRNVYVRNLPTISLYGDNPYIMEKGSSYNEPGYIGRDWNNQALAVSISGFINPNVVGTYNLVYKVVDSLNGSKTVNRIVIVKDTKIKLKDALMTNLPSENKYTADNNVTYIRGELNKVNNYVWWSGMMWRVYAINPDGSIKIITDDNVSAVSIGYPQYGYNGKGIKKWLETYFYPKLNGSKDTVLKQNNDFCVDSSEDVNSVRTTCSSIVPNLKIGLLTLDEHNIVKNASNTTPDFHPYYHPNYLNNGTIYWLMTHSERVYVEVNGPDTRYYNYYSYTGIASVGITKSVCGIRPVLVFTPDLTISIGHGTENDPYKVTGDTAPAVSGTKLNLRHTGEFISYDNKLWRIIEVSGELTKVIYDGSTVMPKSRFGSADGASTDSDGYLVVWKSMSEKLNEIGISTAKIAQNIKWGRGSYDWRSYAINEWESSLNDSWQVTTTFGLPKVAEMWASQSNNNTRNYAKFTAQEYWLMNACGEADTYHNPDFLIISDVGTVNPRSNFGFVMRPVFFFKSDTIIASGNGTPDSPYTLQ